MHFQIVKHIMKLESIVYLFITCINSNKTSFVNASCYFRILKLAISRC